METKIIYRNKFFQIIIAILVPLILGWIASLNAMRFKEPWYSRLQRPAYSPPDVVSHNFFKYFIFSLIMNFV